MCEPNQVLQIHVTGNFDLQDYQISTNTGNEQEIYFHEACYITAFSELKKADYSYGSFLRKNALYAMNYLYISDRFGRSRLHITVTGLNDHLDR